MDDDDLVKLANQAILIENHYKRPMDIEWAKDFNDDKLYIVQARPETVHNQLKNALTVERYSIEAPKDAKILSSGRAVGDKVGVGKV